MGSNPATVIQRVFKGDTEIELLRNVLPILAEDAAHATLGASSAARWMACPGSINLISTLPPRDGDASSDNIAARTGRCAHQVAEITLQTFGHASDSIGQTYHGVEVTEEMTMHVQLYVDHVRKVLSIPNVVYWIEKKFSLASLNPPMPMFGTADFSAYDPATRTLYVDDLKYGQGVMVEVEGNPQLKYYALGVWLSLPHDFVVENVVMTIVQPRKDHPEGFIRTAPTITAAELAEFSIELLDAARATLDPNAPLHAGDHCKFCPAKARCPELYKETQAIAATEFDEAPLPIVPPPTLIPREQFAEMLTKLHILDDWSAAMKEHAYQELLAGRPVPGFKLVERRAERKWVDEEAVKSTFATAAKGLPTQSMFEKQKLKSVAQMEKIVGKKKFKEHFAPLVTKQSSGLKIVPEDHPSPPVLMGGTEFDMLPAPDSDNEGKSTEKNEQ